MSTHKNPQVQKRRVLRLLPQNGLSNDFELRSLIATRNQESYTRGGAGTNALLCIRVCTGSARGSAWARLGPHWNPMRPHRIHMDPEARITYALLCIWACTGSAWGSVWARLGHHWNPMRPYRLDMDQEARNNNAFQWIWGCTGKRMGSECGHTESHMGPMGLC